MCEPDRNATESLTRDDLYTVLAWVLLHYSGTGVVEVGPAELAELKSTRIGVERTDDSIIVRVCDAGSGQHDSRIN